MTTREIIAPIIYGTYGAGSMIDALIGDLADKIDNGKVDSRGLHYMVMITCWDWMSGGGTAYGAADRILAALKENES